MDYKRLIDERYFALEGVGLKAEKRFNLLNEIIQLKIASDLELKSYKQTVYLDIKHFLQTYIQCLLDRDSNYDVINFDAVTEKLDILDTDERINILKFFERALKKEYLTSDAKKCYFLRRPFELQLCWESKQKKHKLRYLMLYATKNIVTILIAFLILIFLYSLLTLPSTLPYHFFYVVDYPFTGVDFLDHFLSVLCSLLELHPDTKIEPINIPGVIILLVVKLVFILILGEYLLAELHKRTNFD